MKVTYTQTLARKILLAFLAFVILLSVAALFVRNSISKKLESISNLSNTNESDQSEPEKVLMLLHKADNDFQESLVNTNKKKRVDYKTELSLAFGKIDTLLKKQTDTTNLTLHQRVKVRDWYDKKLILSNKLFILKHGFDSLLTVYANFNTPSVGNQPLLSTTVNSGKTDVKISADTVKKAAQKKGLMKRLKDAIVNKDAGTAGVAEIHHNKSSKETDIATQKIVTKNNIAYNKKLQQLQQQNVKLLNTQRQLIILNTHIINELDGIINDIKDINYTIADEFKGMALNSYQESTSLLNMLYLIALFLVLAFAGLLIIFIIQLNKSELHLRKEVERSVAIAQQKMELLHHMSHEIRNPLTAIKGFLYIFSKSNMSSKQLEMLESITLSSDMMLRTLTDTLDAAKMESSELKINTEPFNPDFTLKKTVESMAFSATKKKLSLDYNFIGNKDTVLIGDSFRLKQIVVNLLSNAIKYTQQGSITVNAQLLPGSDNRLQVDVIDTGAGISLEQQANLFSKYYQTNSSKGQVGTGLGLFICKQLVKLQGGKISVKSNQGAGTTFTFFIPYQKSNNPVVVNDTNDLLSLLSGKSILAVDDNQLNLMFLKKMTEKWNVIFHQASNGNEALDIISKHEITIILTDLQMPEMDGEMLLSKIKKLSEPLNRIPVIVISGNIVPADQERIFKMGFSGIVSKPFVETELMDQFMNVLGRNEA
jgi:two-component system sensor histidine kinase BarA